MVLIARWSGRSLSGVPLLHDAVRFIVVELPGLKCVQRNLDIAGNCIIKQVHCIRFVKKKQVNLSYSACHEKR